MPANNLNHFKSVFAHKFFVSQADRNYYLARFSRIFGMHEEFWWQAAQAIEKLLKAGLICNGVSVKSGFGHDIEKLWEKHLEVFSELGVREISKPDTLAGEVWNGRSLQHFISSANKLGNPDTRYGLVGHYTFSDDLFILDRFIYELRRRTIGLDWVVGADWDDPKLQSFYGKPYREVIRKLPNQQIRELNPPKGQFETVGTDLADVHYSWNFAFLRSNEDITKAGPSTIAPKFPNFGNSYLFLHYEQLQNNPKDPALQEQTRWLLDNVKIHKDIEKNFRNAMN